MSRTVVIGIGNAYRGDDAAGREVARRVQERAADEVDVVVCGLEPTRLIDAWEGADAAVVVDAVSSEAEPGTVHRFDATAEALRTGSFARRPTRSGSATRSSSRARSAAAGAIIVFGIEGEAFGSGTELSGPAQEGVERAVELVLEEAGCTSRR